MTADIQTALRLGREHHEAGRLPQAEQLYRQILANEPNQPQALFLLGVLAGQCGHHDQALELIGRAVAADPNSVEANFNYGIALQAHQLHERAAGAFQAAIRLKPGFAQAHGNLGLALANLGQLDEAIASYRTAVQLQPSYADAYGNLGAALLNKGWSDQAVVACRRAIELQPQFAAAHNNLGNALKDLGRYDEAVAAFDKAISLEPNLAEAHCNRGGALRELGRPQEALTACQRAIELNPTHVEVHGNLGIVLLDLGRIDEAAAAYRRALELDPNHAAAHFNLALAHLIRGDLTSGWVEHEWRWKCKDRAGERRHFKESLWTGSDLGGRTILLHAEQGLGDSIQFIRYVPLVKARGGRVIVECPSLLMRLLEQMEGVDAWVSRGDPLPPFDVQCPFLSLPLALGTTLENIPAYPNPLRAPANLVAQWHEKVTSLGPSFKLKVGLAWAGNPDHKNDRNRSIRLERLAPLAKAGNVQFVSLQKGPAADQAKNPPSGLSLVDWTTQLNDLVETAALIANLDLVICVDTAIAHLAGAMGKPVWVMLPFPPDWRWLLHRSDSPWYSSMRLFRQPSFRNWDTPIKRVALELEKMRG